jgi:hypothetical protein
MLPREVSPRQQRAFEQALDSTIQSQAASGINPMVGFGGASASATIDISGPGITSGGVNGYSSCDEYGCYTAGPPGEDIPGPPEQVIVNGGSFTPWSQINTAGFILPPQTYPTIIGAGVGSALGRQVGPFIYEQGIKNLWNWGRSEGLTDLEIEEMIAGVEGAEEGGLLTAELGPWAIGGALVGGLIGLGSFYVYDALENAPTVNQSTGPKK